MRISLPFRPSFGWSYAAPRVVAILIFSIFLTLSCTKEQGQEPSPEPENSVADLIAQDSAFSSLAELLELNSLLKENLSNPEVNITLLAPTNKAFEKYQDTIPANSWQRLENSTHAYNVINYMIIRGRYDLESMNSGIYVQEYCGLGGWFCPEMLVENTGGLLMINGGDHKGAVSTGRVLEAANGNIIEVNDLPLQQYLMETLDDAQFLYDTRFFQGLIAKTSPEFQSRAKSDYFGELMVADEAQILKVFDIYLDRILDEEDLDGLLNSNQRDSLLSRYNVSTSEELLLHITLNDLQNFVGNTRQEIYNELDDEDYDAWVEHLLISEGRLQYIVVKDPKDKKAHTRASVTYNVAPQSDGSVLLTDTDGHVIKLDGRLVNSRYGAIWLIADVY